MLVESSKGVGNISEVIRNITETADKSSRGANETLEASNRLGKMSEQLQVLINDAKTGNE